MKQIIKRFPLIAVLGHKNSGKTLTIETVIGELSKAMIKVAAIRYISDLAPYDDRKDAWRYSRTGANPIIAISDEEILTRLKNGNRKITLENLLDLTPKSDAVFLEGLSSLVTKNERVAKIVCVRDLQEYEDYQKKVKGKIIAFCSLKPLETKDNLLNQILLPTRDRKILLEKTIRFLKIENILSKLGGTDCGKCNYVSCEKLAEEIYDKRADTSDCVSKGCDTRSNTKIEVDNTDIILHPFVAKIINKSVMGMISTLKGVSINGDEKLYIKILKEKKT